eukprot:scaffold34679_cov116-Cyclotella_meneghiniana.AAC.2
MYAYAIIMGSRRASRSAAEAIDERYTGRRAVAILSEIWSRSNDSKLLVKWFSLNIWPLDSVDGDSECSQRRDSKDILTDRGDTLIVEELSGLSIFYSINDKNEVVDKVVKFSSY